MQHDDALKTLIYLKLYILDWTIAFPIILQKSMHHWQKPIFFILKSNTKRQQNCK